MHAPNRFPPLDTLKGQLLEVLDAWEILEEEFFAHFRLLLQAGPASVSEIVFRKISSFQTTREIAELLAVEFLPDGEALAYQVLMARLQKMTTKRSRLIHGYWAKTEIEQADGTCAIKWHRKYESPMLDNNVPETNAEHTKTKGVFRWYADDLKRAIDEMRQLARDMHPFRMTISKAILARRP
jgi:hypothetical protein